MQNSVEGAKGIEAFENGIEYGYLPSETSIQHEGLFYDYYFETSGEKDKLFKANYSVAVSQDPFSGSKEYYIGVGLSGCMDGDGLYKHGGRPGLNLVIVLDISGSMEDVFNSSESASKLEVAKNSILALLGKLNEKDRFGLILFDDRYDVLCPLSDWKSINQAKLKDDLMKVKTRGGTIIRVGIEGAVEQYKKNPSKSNNSNRIIFLTDGLPSGSETNDLLRMSKENAKNQIYTTFVGLGIDFNTDLISQLASIKGSNYFSVKSSKEFKKQMDAEFDYMVTISVFNVSIDISSHSWVPERVYGSPGHEFPEKGQLLFIDSSFPSPTEGDKMTKGGIVVVKVKKVKDSNEPLLFNVTYEDRDGKKYQDKDKVEIEEQKVPFYSNISMRKAVLLVRYVNFMKHFLRDYRKKGSSGTFVPSITMKSGILIPPVDEKSQTHSESRISDIDPEYKAMFDAFVDHFEKEMDAIGDQKLEKELKNLNTLISKFKK